MKRAIVAIVFISSFIGISTAHAGSCPAGQGTAVDVNATTQVVTYSCITLPTPPPAPIIVPTPAPSASTPNTPVVSAPDTSTATTSTATITPPPVVTQAPPVVVAAPSNNDAFLAMFNRLLNIIYALMLKLGISVG
jgi:hypothetical protein